MAQSNFAIYSDEQMTSIARFERAAAYENLAYLLVVREIMLLSEADRRKLINKKTYNDIEVYNWLEDRLYSIINSLRSYQDIYADFLDLKQFSDNDAFIAEMRDQGYGKWLDYSLRFYRTYVLEQLKMKVLFPRITSEIDRLDSAEILGDEFQIMQFLLTFDDGPTRVEGSTDRIIELLRKEKIPALFFVLGENLNKRLSKQSASKVNELYRGFHIGSHGYIHKPHRISFDWKTSLDKTRRGMDLVGEVKKPLFRPPYGQRTKELLLDLKKNREWCVLWNIDSRDWNKKMHATEVAQRTIKLMLLKRKGIILFHDIHWRTAEIVPMVFDYFRNSPIQWKDANYLENLSH
ncbi:MAG: polysaccharide deacetylase family protein [Flavobacteriaceae bacterium]|nr:polysaccharide deacetylase family protein [Flavobacteriaceae bacterium]